MRIGVLAIQGDVREHRRHLERLGVDAPEVRRPAELSGLAGLIMPGGESSTIGMLMTESGLLAALRARMAEGFPVYGTCAGMILLANRVEGSRGTSLSWIGGLDVTVARNAYGRQVQSFEADIPVSVLGEAPLHVVFIRAPRIVTAGPAVHVLGRLDDEAVLVEQGPLLASSFHPELTDDLRIHRYFSAKAQRFLQDGAASLAT